MKSAQSFWYQVLWCLILLKLVVLAVRVLVSPGRSDNRLVTVSDSTAQQMLAWSLLVAGSLVLSRPLVSIATDFGADTDTALLLSMIFGTLFIILLILLIVRLRRYGAALILGDSSDAGEYTPGPGAHLVDSVHRLRAGNLAHVHRQARRYRRVVDGPGHWQPAFAGNDSLCRPRPDMADHLVLQ